MPPSPAQYTLERHCAACGHCNRVLLSREQAAFDLYDRERLWQHTPCSRCGACKTASLACDKPDLDAALLELWAQQPDWHFFQQDEDLYLAELAYLPLLLQTFDAAPLTPAKKAVLASALCMLLFNALPASADSNETALQKQQQRQQLLSVLRPRCEALMQCADQMPPYLRTAVLPWLHSAHPPALPA